MPQQRVASKRQGGFYWRGRWAFAFLLTLLFAAEAAVLRGEESDQPALNVVFILADDLGWGELGSYGQTKIPTPNLDRLASEGMRFTQHYSGAPVCAPARCVLMTGKHLGKAEIRGNRQARATFPEYTEGQHPLSEDAITLATRFREGGYATGAMGKWGLGPVGSTGDPNRHGFDLFFGYNCQAVAHSYYPPHLWRNDQRIEINSRPIPGHQRQPEGPVQMEDWIGETYAPARMIEEAEQFIATHRDRPFFLYLPFIEPHVAIHPPRESVERFPAEWDSGVYRGENNYLPHPRPRAGYAAMISDLDQHVGRILAALEREGLAERTLVVFTSDNGPTHPGRANESDFHVGGADPPFFESTRDLRGFKGSVYEGGLRVPMIVRLPGKIPAGSVSDVPGYFADWFPTLCEASGLELPEGLSGESLWSVMLGGDAPESRKPMVWVFPEYGGQVAVRIGDFKVVRQRLRTQNPGPWEVYDLSSDRSEQQDLAEERQDIIDAAIQILKDEALPNEHFPVPIPELAAREVDQATSLVSAGESQRPNILWITSEDNSPYLGCYGDPLAQTPHLDQLAREGVRYRHAFANAPVCSTARTTLITGMYATSLGAQHHRSRVAIPDAFQLYPTHLRAAGYYCTNNAKTDYNLVGRQEVWDESSRQAHYRNRAEGQPFFAIFNLMVSHEGQVAPPAEKQAFRIAPEEFPLPPFHPDTPEIRRDWAHYYDQMTAMDRQVGALLEELDREGLADSTIVFYYSDHGGALPGGKRNIHDSGTHVPMIIRLPDKWKEWAPASNGDWVDDVVSFVDFPATLLSLAGVPVPENYEGRPFLGEQRTDPREFAYLYRGRMDERYDTVRAVRDAKFRYVRNYSPHRPWGQYYSYPFQVQPSMRSWYAEYVAGRCDPVQARYWERKPGEEFYRIEGDPWELENRLEERELQDEIARLRAYLRDEILATRDTGFIPEGMMARLAGQQTIHDYAQSDAYPLEEILELANQASDGQVRHLPELMAALESPHPILRYWGATGCLILQERAAPAKAKLLELLDDDWGDVRVVAAEGVAYLGERQKGAETIESVLKTGSFYEVLAAQNALDFMWQAGHVTLEEAQAMVRDREDEEPANRIPRYLLGRP